MEWAVYAWIAIGTLFATGCIESFIVFDGDQISDAAIAKAGGEA